MDLIARKNSHTSFPSLVQFHAENGEWKRSYVSQVGTTLISVAGIKHTSFVSHFHTSEPQIMFLQSEILNLF
jgi:hypothetical protein